MSINLVFSIVIIFICSCNEASCNQRVRNRFSEYKVQQIQICFRQLIILMCPHLCVYACACACARCVRVCVWMPVSAALVLNYPLQVLCVCLFVCARPFARSDCFFNTTMSSSSIFVWVRACVWAHKCKCVAFFTLRVRASFSSHSDCSSQVICFFTSSVCVWVHACVNVQVYVCVSVLYLACARVLLITQRLLEPSNLLFQRGHVVGKSLCAALYFFRFRLFLLFFFFLLLLLFLEWLDVN